MALSIHRMVARGAAVRRLFHLSNLYLMLVFCGLAVDAVIGLPVLGWPF